MKATKTELIDYLAQHGCRAVVVDDRICAWALYGGNNKSFWRAEWIDATWRDVRAFLGY